MSRSKFELNLDTVRKLALFVLNSLADQPKEWVAVGKAYQELHGFGDERAAAACIFMGSAICPMAGWSIVMIQH